MDAPALESVAYHARRFMRTALAGLAFTIVVAAVAALSAPTNRHSALFLLFWGVLAILGGRTLRAGSRLLRLTDPRAPRSVAWAAPVSFGVGVAAILFACACLAMTSHPAP